MAIRGERPASIAAEPDFADQAHLGRAINLHTGLTPRTIGGATRDPLPRLFLEASDELLVVRDHRSQRLPDDALLPSLPFERSARVEERA